MINECRISIFDLRNILFLIFSLVVISINAQNTPTLKFQMDSVLIGEPTPISYVYTHNFKEEVLFADSTYDFSPFEYDRIDVFKTETNDTISKDSVIYWLSTFELDKIQSLKIPVFIYKNNDSIPFYSNVDSITLTEIITVLSDTLHIKENANLQVVENEFNYPIFFIVIGSFAVIGLILLIIFRKKITQYFKLKKLNKLHQIFLSDFDKLILKFKANQSKENLEELIVCWKEHLEKIQSKPITKLSTKELKLVILKDNIINFLSKADGMIFGNIPFEKASENFNELSSYIENIYSKKIEDIKNEGN